MQRVWHMGALMVWVWHGRRGKTYVLGQEHWTDPILLSHLFQPEVTSSPSTSVDSSVKWRLSSSSITCSRPVFRSCGLQAAMWTQGETSKGTPATLGDQPQIDISALPWGRRTWDGRWGSTFTDTSTSANPMKVEFSNKINLLVWSVFCNFC